MFCLANSAIRNPNVLPHRAPPPQGRSGIGRAVTTGAIPQSGVPSGRGSPFQTARGGIPTIPTAQLGGSSEVSSVISGGAGASAGAGAPAFAAPVAPPAVGDEGAAAPVNDNSQNAISDSDDESESEDPFK